MHRNRTLTVKVFQDIFSHAVVIYRNDMIGILTRATYWTAMDSPLLNTIHTRSGAHPASYSVGTGGLSLSVKCLGLEGDQAQG
jgi:hypothetical protein